MQNAQDNDREELLLHCRGLYRRTKSIWYENKGQYATWECRFSILYGPPLLNPDLLIVGSNPGFNPDDLYDEEIQTWPEENEYTSRNWPLARKLRLIFQAAGKAALLERSLGINRLFFKSNCLGRDKESGLGWGDNPLHIRRALEAFCEREVDALVGKLKPKLVLTLGLGVFDKMAETVSPTRVKSKGRRLFATGTVGDVRLIGLIHPTGAQVSREDWAKVTDALTIEMREA